MDLGESFPTSIYLQNLASMQPRTSRVKFARSPRTDPPGFTNEPTRFVGITICIHQMDASRNLEFFLDDPRCQGSFTLENPKQ